MATLLLILCVISFLVAMLLYAVLLLRLRKPLSFFDLPGWQGRHSSLARWTWRSWSAAILLALAFGVAMLAPRG